MQCDIEATEDAEHVRRETAPARILQLLRHAVEGLRDAAGYTGQRITIASE